jgi:hypothetical protein
VITGERVVVDGVPVRVLHPPAKALRAGVIATHLQGGADRPRRALSQCRVVCFTSGNAARALEAEGLDVLAVGPGEGLSPGRWWQPHEIADTWPDRFDATSGHLPMHLMAQLSQALRAHLGALDPGPWLVPTGSGETLCALALAYPHADLWALTHADSHTDHHDGMPLAPLVARRRVVDVRALATADGPRVAP